MVALTVTPGSKAITPDGTEVGITVTPTQDDIDAGYDAFLGSQYPGWANDLDGLKAKFPELPSQIGRFMSGKPVFLPFASAKSPKPAIAAAPAPLPAPEPPKPAVEPKLTVLPTPVAKKTVIAKTGDPLSIKHGGWAHAYSVTSAAGKLTVRSDFAKGATFQTLTPAQLNTNFYELMRQIYPGIGTADINRLIKDSKAVGAAHFAYTHPAKNPTHTITLPTTVSSN